MFSKVLVLVPLAASLVAAQYPACATDCVTAALTSAGCTGLDLGCICPSLDKITASALPCITKTSTCTQGDIDTLESLLASVCPGASVSSSASAETSSATSSDSTTSSPTTTATEETTSSFTSTFVNSTSTAIFTNSTLSSSLSTPPVTISSTQSTSSPTSTATNGANAGRVGELSLAALGLAAAAVFAL